ncbi:Transketolase family protein [Sulfidibacter corallicola]|uniref:Transketolase family protein n=1 Tax=Sulfidibacter corallicola TaxID=2818388 RepID=A0A8A4TWF4_SULCO|nr:transketolase C-terminal domain-containing protein [Sulfidibacter corallicola]QTD53508.1 transketolase family protein [Sulfidibacter corallicola]
MDLSPPPSRDRPGESLKEAFGRALVRLGKTYPNFVVLDSDVAGVSGTHHFRRAFGDRFYQCGIAEQNMVSLAAGMSAVGLPVLVSTYAVYCLRSLEQVRQSVAYPHRNVKIVASHSGLDVGPDGASTQCVEDLAAFRAIPGMVVLSPADPHEVAQATEAILKYPGPVYMRTGQSSARSIMPPDQAFTIGRATVLRDGRDATLVACGTMVAKALDAAESLVDQGLDVRVVNMATIKPIDQTCLLTCARETGCFITAEDHNVFAGLGGAVAEVLAQHMPCPLEMIGVDDTFGESGEPEELAEKYGLTEAAIVAAVLRAVARKRR